MDINRKALSAQLAKEYGYKKKDAIKFIDNLTALILKNMEEGNSVSIYGFGCFDLLKRKSHVCPNNRSGKMMEIPEHYMPRFYPGARMYAAVKRWDEVELGADE